MTGGDPDRDPGPAATGGPGRGHDVLVDAAGLRCPLPVIRLAAAARAVPAGGVVAVRSTDPAAGADVAAWCRMRGHVLLDQREELAPGGAVLVSRVRVGPAPAAAAHPAPGPAGGGTPPG